MKPRPAPVPLCSLAAAFAAAGILPTENAPRPYRKDNHPPSTIHPPRSYPPLPWRTSTPIIQPPPPPIAARWEVWTCAEERKVYVESIDKKTGKPCLIPSTLLVRTATLTSATGHGYELSTTSRVSRTKGILPGSTVRAMLPRDLAMRATLRDAIAEIELTGERLPAVGKKKPKLTESCQREIRALRAEMTLLGTRHLPDAILADLTGRIGTAEAAVVVDFLLSK